MRKRVESFFAPGGPLDQAMDGYVYRQAQPDITDELLDLAGTGGVYLLNAPTGTGKGSIYGSAILHSGQGAIVSTHTIQLQSQLLGKDFPTLHEAATIAGMDAPTARKMLGRANFLCNRRWDDRVKHGKLQIGLDDDLDEFAAWAAETKSGNIREYNDRAPSFFPQVQAERLDCNRKKCDFAADCFYYLQRADANESDIIIVNHKLLMVNIASGGKVFDMRDRLVVADEAHNLAEVAADTLGREVTRFRVVYVASIVLGNMATTEETMKLSECINQESKDYFADLRSPNYQRLNDRNYAPPSLTPLLESLRSLRSMALSHTKEEVRDTTDAVDGLVNDINFFYEDENDDYAYAIEGVKGKRGFPKLKATLVEPGKVLVEKLFAREPAAATILTSATLSIGDDFSFTRQRLGIDKRSIRSSTYSGPPLKVIEKVAPEAFNYAEQALVYIATDLPTPDRNNRERFDLELPGRIAELVDAATGRTLVLVTANRTLTALRESLPPLLTRLGYPVRFQGDMANLDALVGWLRTSGGVLVGTRGLFEGVDVKGESLSQVIVDKLPFDAPNPVTEKLQAKVKERGGNPFTEVIVPLAARPLAQGGGRLIRSDTDRGVIAILDNRLVTKQYGRQMLRALPPSAPITHNLADVRRFFGDDPPTSGAGAA